MSGSTNLSRKTEPNGISKDRRFCLYRDVFGDVHKAVYIRDSDVSPLTALIEVKGKQIWANKKQIVFPDKKEG
ncbi:hypothetical protein GCM10010965_27560 [Caldalkalibacillus thermarum]|uniref:hypothetical protein n=1 Tax=Caldalkalibacillus thermarum TaxID=296745 RepID=UPI00166833B0|nr:hypothetical protein [Caldalkalibacillus thermarum]GGK33193.1 hypothetical protein GCM10010965_27560 [Caldalkalibacillus thermarum]